MQSLARLQADPEPSIRTNTTIFYGRLASKLKDQSHAIGYALALPARESHGEQVDLKYRVVRLLLAAAFREAFHTSTEQSEARITSFITVFEQQLKAETDPEQRSIVLAPALQMRHEPCGPEVGHGGVKSSDPRKDQSVNAIELISAFDQPAVFT